MTAAAREHDGKVAVITGGGRGFGKAFGRALTQQGAHVVLVDIDGEAAREAAEEIEREGGSASPFSCDVTDEAGVNAMVADTIGRFGGIDILVNNAGLHSAAYNEPMSTSGVSKLRRLFDVNVMGVIVCTLAAQEAMAARSGACIVNLSSSAAYGCGTAYGVSKLAVQGVTMTSARELGPSGIRVNAIAPGLIFTDTIRAELDQTTVAMVKNQQVLGRDGEERDIVEALLFLCSSRSRFITGETLRVSGGFTLAI
jgi:NAD(P)-dependent dehydrogenase (short-subunit alcohol dehydrogenase family)